jgi:cytochrome c553
MKRLLAVVVLAACGSSAPKPTTPPPAAKLAWKDMNADQRFEYMKTSVLPAAKAKFQAFDATKYAELDCSTCHGDGAEDGSYEMPNPKIKALPATAQAFEAWIAQDADAKRYSDFMSSEIVPMMATLFDEPELDPKTAPKGLSCPVCHTMEGDDAGGKSATGEKN